MGCEIHLLAKDSIYILDPPRRLKKLFMWPGSRTDVMMRCSTPGTMQINGTGAGIAQIGFKMVAPVLGNLYQFEVVGPKVDSADLRPFSTQRPCYLADTRSLMGGAYVTKHDMIMNTCPEGEAHGDVGNIEHRRQLAAGGPFLAPSQPTDLRLH